MNIKESKIELIKLILDTDDDKLIKKAINFIQNEKSDFWNELSSSEQAEIKEGIEQLNRGKRKPYKEITL